MNPVPLFNEKELFTRIAAGDEGAFKLVFDFYKDRLYSFLLRMVKQESTAEELVQEVFMLVWSKRHHLEVVENPSSYLYTIARNRATDHFRKMALDRELANQVWNRIVEYQNETELRLDLIESKKIIAEAVQKLTPAQQRVFQLSRVEGFTHDQIASQLGISRNTVKNHMVDALRIIRDYLRAHSDDLSVLFILAFSQAVMI